jgi:hypothetical protein
MRSPSYPSKPEYDIHALLVLVKCGGILKATRMIRRALKVARICLSQDCKPVTTHELNSLRDKKTWFQTFQVFHA